MSDEKIEKIKAIIKDKSELAAEKVVQCLDDVVVQAKKSYGFAAPWSKAVGEIVVKEAREAQIAYEKIIERTKARAKARAEKLAQDDLSAKSKVDSGPSSKP